MVAVVAVERWTELDWPGLVWLVRERLETL